MTSKERAQLRAQANSLEPLFQIGKGGISDALIKQTEDALKANELIKLKVHLESSPETPKETAQKLAAATSSESVQVIGGCIVLYKYNAELHKKPAAAKKVVKGTKSFKNTRNVKKTNEKNRSFRRDV